jgi:hypothetical protein
VGIVATQESLDTRYASRKAKEIRCYTGEDSDMENRKCPVLVNGGECGLELVLIDQDIDTEIGTYECPRGHRTNVLLGAVERQKCAALVEGGKECGRALLVVDRDLDTATAINECALDHRTYAPLAPEAVDNS